MSLSRGSRRRLLVLPVGLLMVGLALPAVGQDPNPFAGLPAYDEYGFQGEGEARLRDVDARDGVVPPSAEAVALAERLGADDARWNDFGTPHVLFNRDGALAGPREGAAADVARAFVRTNAALFRLDGARVDALEVFRDAPLYDSPDLALAYDGVDETVPNEDVAHVVTFKQRFDGLETALGGVLTVGVQRNGSVVWVTSTVTGDRTVSGQERLSAADAVRAAAADVDIDLGTLTPAAAQHGWTTFASDVTPDLQRVRPVALPTPSDGVRRAWGVTLIDSQLDEHGNPSGFTVIVDAETGKVWQRTNRLEHLGAA